MKRLLFFFFFFKNIIEDHLLGYTKALFETLKASEKGINRAVQQGMIVHGKLNPQAHIHVFGGWFWMAIQFRR